MREASHNTVSPVERALNVLTGLAAIAFLVVAVQYVWNRGAVEMPVEGSTVPVKGIDWAKNGRTLLLAMQPDCPYCEASIPFYRDLLVSTAGRGVQVVAVFPQPVPVAREVLRSYNLQVANVVQEQFSRLKVPGSPTLLLVDASGKITKTWIGRLTEALESDVFETLSLSRVRTPADPVRTAKIAATGQRSMHRTLEPGELAKVLADVTVLDTRPRHEYNETHIRGAVNIPMDEMDARVGIELPRDRRVVVFCSFCAECSVVAVTEGMASLCDESVGLLGRGGYKDVHVVASGIQELRAAGIPVETSAATH